VAATPAQAVTDPSASARIRVTRLTCRAPHPDPGRSGDLCGTLLAVARGEFVLVAIADDAPATLDAVARTVLEQESADTWLRCSARGCGKWNRFRVVAV
jgi:hypothetical protein